ncbi:hypothetical protein F5B18DRAFT_669145 [Nemania serpens]|nr:hypothetical protein F5B18DRAFT_669145 [Nemania serpens]
MFPAQDGNQSHGSDNNRRTRDEDAADGSTQRNVSDLNTSDWSEISALMPQVGTSITQPQQAMSQYPTPDNQSEERGTLQSPIQLQAAPRADNFTYRYAHVSKPLPASSEATRFNNPFPAPTQPSLTPGLRTRLYGAELDYLSFSPPRSDAVDERHSQGSSAVSSGTNQSSSTPGLGTQIYGAALDYLSFSPPRSDAVDGRHSQGSSAVPSGTNQFSSTTGQGWELSLGPVGGAAHQSSNSSSSSSRPSGQITRQREVYHPSSTQSTHHELQFILASFPNPNPQIQVTPSSPPSGSGPRYIENASDEQDTGSNPPTTSTGASSHDVPETSSSQDHLDGGSPQALNPAYMEAQNGGVEEQEENPSVKPFRDPIALVLGCKYDVFNGFMTSQVIGQCLDSKYRNTSTAIATYHQLAMADDLFFEGIWRGKFLVNESYIFEYHYPARSRPYIPDQARCDRRVIFVWARNRRTRTSGWHKVVEGYICPDPCEMQAPPAEYEETLNLLRYFFQKAGGLLNMNRYAKLVAPEYIDNSQDAVSQNKRAINAALGPTASRSAYSIATPEIMSSDTARSIPDFIPSKKMNLSPIDFSVDVDTQDSDDATVGEFFNMEAASSSSTAPVNDVSGSSVPPTPATQPLSPISLFRNDEAPDVSHDENLGVMLDPETDVSDSTAPLDPFDIHGLGPDPSNNDDFPNFFEEALASFPGSNDPNMLLHVFPHNHRVPVNDEEENEARGEGGDSSGGDVQMNLE